MTRAASSAGGDLADFIGGLEPPLARAALRSSLDTQSAALLPVAGRLSARAWELLRFGDGETHADRSAAQRRLSSFLAHLLGLLLPGTTATPSVSLLQPLTALESSSAPDP